MIDIAICCGCAAARQWDVLQKMLRTQLTSENVTAYYEAFLQIYLFAGFPHAIAVLNLFARMCRELEIVPHPHSESYDASLFRHRGEQLCRKIYTTVYEKMRDRLHQISPELEDWMIVEGYGKTLSRPGLDVQARELCALAVLTVLDWPEQQYAHLRGALNVGVSPEQCRAVLRGISNWSSNEAIERGYALLDGKIV